MSVKLSIAAATDTDIGAIVALRNAVAGHLTERHGRGHWSNCVADGAVARAIKSSMTFVARHGNNIVGTIRIATKKPWAIDVGYFTAIERAAYLHDLAVDPRVQRRGIARQLVEHAKVVCASLPANAIRLDAYDAPAGAADFYVKCGFRERGRVVYRGVPLIYFEMLL